jgi:hypothetical protein
LKKKGLAMKKNKPKDQEQERQPRRLGLSRETIRLLNDRALLELARGGGTWSFEQFICESVTQ